jgi:hypothetical protein
MIKSSDEHIHYMGIIEQIIIDLVSKFNGIRDIELTMETMKKIPCETIENFLDQKSLATYIAKTIQNMIKSGQLIGIDCETPSGEYTYILPIGSRAKIALPIYVKEHKTKH